MSFKDLKIKTKLISVLLTIGLTSVAVVGYLGYHDAKQSVSESTKHLLTALREVKKQEIEGYFQESLENVDMLPTFPIVREAVKAFEEAYEKSGLKLSEFVKSREFNNLDKKYGPIFTKYMKEYGYYDLFLINAKGDVLYTVAREADFGTNVAHGKYADTGLGKVYKEGLREEVLTDFEPYAPANGDAASFIGAPIKWTDGEVHGVIALQIPIGKVNTIMQKRTGLGESGETYLVGPDKLLRSDSRFSEGSTILKQKVDTESVREALAGKTDCKIITGHRGIDIWSSYTKLNIKGVDWVVLAEIDDEEVMRPVVAIRNQALLVAIVIGAIVAAVAFFFAQSLANPITRAVEVLKKVALGDLSETITADSKDEIGDLANATSTMVESLKEMAGVSGKLAEGDINIDFKPKSDRDVMGNAMVTMVESLKNMATVTEKIAQGDLTVDFKPKSERDVMGKALLKMETDLSNVVGNILVSSENVSSGSSEIAAGNQDLSQRSQEQASALEETASTVEQMTSNIKANAENAEKANQLARTAAEAAQQGGKVVEKTVHQMEAVTESSKKIADIIDTVNEIAFQTNLLALNAAVEAARAGEQGRGFAVVAGEVRNLAGRSAEAAKEIQTLIRDSVEKIETGNKLVEDTGATLKTIIESVNNVANNISEISSASQEQSAGIDQVNKAVSQMDEVVQQNASLVEEAAATSENLASEADEMQRMMGTFKVNTTNINIHNNKDSGSSKSEKKTADPTSARTAIANKYKDIDPSDEFAEF